MYCIIYMQIKKAYLDVTFHLSPELTLLGGSGPHEGNIFLDGRPVCDDMHTADEHGRQNALVVCRSENIPTQPTPFI